MFTSWEWGSTITSLTHLIKLILCGVVAGVLKHTVVPELIFWNQTTQGMLGCEWGGHLFASANRWPCESVWPVPLLVTSWMPTRWHCVHSLSCGRVRQFKSHTSDCGEAVVGSMYCKYVHLAECEHPSFLWSCVCNSFQMWLEIDSVHFYPPWHPLSCPVGSVYRWDLWCLSRAFRLTEATGFGLCSNRYSGRVLLSVILIYPDGTVVWLLLVSSACLRSLQQRVVMWTKKPSANVASTTAHPEWLVEMSHFQ